MLDVTYPLFPIFAFLGFILVLVPLPWHLQAWNSGTCFFMIWTSLACFNQFVNSVVWAGNALNPAPWWCEISIRILMGASVGIPASSLCIVRRLYKIASAQAVTVSPAEKCRIVLLDTLVCVLFPILYIALQYVVQGHRFDIFEDIGCYPALYNTLPSYFLSFMWPVLIGLTSVVYCGLALWEFNKRRIQFSHFLQSNTSLTLSRYFRLMALAMTEMFSTTPLAIFVIYLNATTSEIGPWRSWDDTHFGYSRVNQYPALLWRRNHQLVVSMELTRWLAPFCAIVFFCFFGFAQEAQKQYLRAYLFITKYLRFLPLPSKNPASKHKQVPENDTGKAARDLPMYSPSTKHPEKAAYLLRSSTISSECASMTDVSSKYESKIPLTPYFEHPSSQTIGPPYPMTPFSPTTLDDSERGWSPPSSTHFPLAANPVALHSSIDSRRLTI